MYVFDSVMSGENSNLHDDVPLSDGLEDKHPWVSIFCSKLDDHSGYVSSVEEMNKMIREYEVSTGSRFTCVGTAKHFGETGIQKVIVYINYQYKCIIGYFYFKNMDIK